MPLLECVDLAKDWAGTPVFSRLSFSVDPGEKIGLIGRNGGGKTTLARILAGLDDDFHGSLKRSPGLRVALVPQRFEPPAGVTCATLLTEEADALARRLDADAEELGRLQGHELAAALSRYGELRSRYDELGGEESGERAARLLEKAGLGDCADRAASLLSGGEKNILALTLALMKDPDLLVLDEPGNHLDFAGLAWLEDFIRSERRAVIMVSHNRYLLDRTVDRVLELEGETLVSWTGGYSAYRLEKLKRAAGQGKEWQADRKKLERLEALVKRFAVIAASRADPAWGKRLRARRSQLEREKAQAAEKPRLDDRRMNVEFSGETSRADYALVLRGYSRAFGDRKLFGNADLDLLTGERAAIVGPNGCGKTTLLRDIVAVGSRWDGEIIKVGPSMLVGYCAQEQEVFDKTGTVAREFRLLGAGDEDTAKLLRRFLFDRSVMDQRIGSLSGGEQNRLQIARAVWLKANFLILDEPTNHLDIEGREAVEEGLADFEGTILAVSHDRYFLEKVAERIIIVEDGRLVSYEGSFGEFWRDYGSKSARAGSSGASSGSRAGIEARARSRKDASPPAARPDTALAKRRAALEGRIADLENGKASLERESAVALSARDYARAGRKAEEAAAASRILEKLYDEWAALQ